MNNRQDVVHPDLYEKLIAAIGRVHHGSDWDLTAGWGAEAKALHRAKYEAVLAAVLPLLGYTPPTTGGADGRSDG